MSAPKPDECDDGERRKLFATFASRTLGLAGMVTPLKWLLGEPKGELAPEADPGEDSIFRPRKPRS